MAFSWSRSADGPNGVSYTTDSGAPPSVDATANPPTSDTGMVANDTGLQPVAGFLPAGRYFNSFSGQQNGFLAFCATDTAGTRSVLQIIRSRGNIGAPTANANNDATFSLQVAAHDGTNRITNAAIQTEVDGAVSTGVAPGRILFKTAATNSASLTEAVRIASTGLTTFTGGIQANGTVNLGAFARVAGSDFTTTNLTATDVTGLSAALVANAVYAFRAVLSVNGADANGLKVAVQFSAAGASVEAGAHGSLTAATAQAVRISALNTLTAAFATSATDGSIVIEGIMPVGANPGNLTIQVAKVTSGTATVRINSFLDVKRIA